MLEKHLDNNTNYSEENIFQSHGRESFRVDCFYSKLADWQIEWVYSQKRFPIKNNDSSIEIVNQLMKKYQGYIK